MKAKKDSADKETIAKARMNFGIVHGICNIINYITTPVTINNIVGARIRI